VSLERQAISVLAWHCIALPAARESIRQELHKEGCDQTLSKGSAYIAVIFQKRPEPAEPALETWAYKRESQRWLALRWHVCAPAPRRAVLLLC